MKKSTESRWMKTTFLVDLDETLIYSKRGWELTSNSIYWAGLYEFGRDDLKPIILTRQEFRKLKEVKSRRVGERPYDVELSTFAQYPKQEFVVDKRQTRLNPFHKEILDYLRSLGYPVRMFTAATWDYAVAHNDLFKLGFEEREIVSRNKYIEPIFWSDPDSRFIIIDNMPLYLNDKLKNINMNNVEYMHFPHFDGRPEYKDFQVMEKLKAFVEKTLAAI